MPASIGCSPYLWAKRHRLRGGVRIVRKTCNPLKAHSASLKPLCSRCRTELEATVLHLREGRRNPVRGAHMGRSYNLHMPVRALACMLSLTSSGKRAGNRLSSLPTAPANAKVAFEAISRVAINRHRNHKNVYYRTDPLLLTRPLAFDPQTAFNLDFGAPTHPSTLKTSANYANSGDEQVAQSLVRCRRSSLS